MQCMRNPVGIVVAVFVLTACLARARDAGELGCARSLTFRWVSGGPIEFNVPPRPGSLDNKPFLVDPEIVQVTTGGDGLHSTITIEMGSAAGDVMRSETASHIGRQVIVMLGDEVLVAAMVRETLGSVIVLNAARESAQFKQMQRLRPGSSGLVCRPSVS